ncbi:RNA polymerase III transcription factor IIIC subunit-domain-containing protein [Gorgonomyces haynaldii]|nr:RNA polymerase III transcription factor IIIC subunit-domain-containing protein [Gorgonomyces haynaldii]
MEIKPDKQVQVDLDPENPLSHRLVSDTVDTSNLLLKVTMIRNTVTGEESFEYEIVGIITKTARFTDLCDFQHALPNTHPAVTVLNQMRELDLEAVQSLELPNRIFVNQESVPPPAFSLVKGTYPYRFQQNPNILEKIIDGKIVMQNTSKRPQVQFIQKMYFVNKSIPEKHPDLPLLEDKDLEQIRTKELISILQPLFEERPIWTRQSLKERIGDSVLLYSLTRALRYISYYNEDGPWRQAWTVFGVDPRKEKSLRIYQTVDFRSNMKPDDDEQDKTRTSGIVQLVDIQDPSLKKLVHSLVGTNTFCDEKFGWYAQDTIHDIRKRIKEKTQDTKKTAEPFAEESSSEDEMAPTQAINRLEDVNQVAMLHSQMDMLTKSLYEGFLVDSRHQSR